MALNVLRNNPWLIRAVAQKRFASMTADRFASASKAVPPQSAFAKDWLHRIEHANKSSRMWKILSFTLVPVSIGICMVNAYYMEIDDHHKARPPFVPYEHLRIRRKPFPWGDGNHSFFHNPLKNALPDGYEVPDPNEGHEVIQSGPRKSSSGGGGHGHH